MEDKDREELRVRNDSVDGDINRDNDSKLDQSTADHDGSKSDQDTIGHHDKRILSEAEAKALLAEETRKTQQNLSKAGEKNKKLLVIAIVVAVAICAIGIGMALVLRNKGDQSGSRPAEYPSQSQTEVKDPRAFTGLEKV